MNHSTTDVNKNIYKDQIELNMSVEEKADTKWTRFCLTDLH